MNVNEMPPAEMSHLYRSVTLGRGRSGNPTEIDAADLSSEVVSINGCWLTPVDDNGEPDGPTTYYPTEIRP